MIPAEAQKKLLALLGSRACLDRTEDLALYEYDASVDKARPDMVVFPRSTADVVGIVNIARQHRIPLVARGAGTGLSGGSIPVEGGIIVAFVRMNRILEIDLANERAVVEPGVVNLDVTLPVQGRAYLFAPDRSSQKACTIGGNVAENAGGPHTLAYGVTTNHVLGLEVVLPDGSVVTTGGAEADLAGYDLTGLLTGSEGTMALVTKVVLRLMRRPEHVKTALAIYNSADDAGRTVTEITARAITPVAVEMLDGVMLRMVEEATHAGYPMDAAAVLLIELEGLHEAVEEQVGEVREVCEACGAREFRVAATPEERDLLWKGRKNAFGAIGRVSPTYYVQDSVVPRTQIAPMLRYIQQVSKVRPHHQQYLPRGRRQHAPHHPVRPAPAGPARKGARRGRRHRAPLHRRRRLHHGRTWRGHGEERADVRDVRSRFDRRHPRPQESVRPRWLLQPRQAAAHRPRLRGVAWGNLLAGNHDQTTILSHRELSDGRYRQVDQ